MTHHIQSAACLTPDHPSSDILVVIPTYNERENIAPLFTALATLAARPSVLMIDDASIDGTSDAIRSAVETYPGQVFLVERTGKHGLGTAYCDAFQWALEHIASAQVVVQMDADLSHDPANIPALVRAASACGVCVGSRYISGGSMPDWKRARRWLSRAANVYAGSVLRLRTPSYRVADSTAGFAAWHRDTLTRLMQNNVPGEGYGFQISMKWLAHRSGFTPHEHAITFHDRRVGQSKLSKRIIAEALAIPWRLLLYRHDNKPPRPLSPHPLPPRTGEEFE